MDPKNDKRVALAAKILLICEESTRKKSVTEAMKDAGFTETENKCPTRAKEAAVRRAFKGINDEKKVSTDLSVNKVHADHYPPVSPLSEVSSALSNSTMLTASKTVLSAMPSKMLPGMKAVRQTSHQVHVMAQNSSLLKKLRDTAIKEATTAWVEASEAEKRGEPHIMKKDIIKLINNKQQYKGFVQVHERTIRCLVSEGFVGTTPPRRGNPGTIPEGAYKALQNAVTSFISIHQASGQHEHRRSEQKR
jgi:hypothetical protein